MDKITINNAATLFGKSRRTIQRYISNGELSFDDLTDGTKLLLVEELELIFGKLSPTVISQMSPNVTTSDNTQLLELLSESNELAKQQLTATKDNTALLRELLNKNLNEDKIIPVKAKELEPRMGSYLDNMTFGE